MSNQTEETMVRREIDARRVFSRWLRSQKPFRRFSRRNCAACPLAVFSGYFVGMDGYGSTKSHISEHALPEWAKQFVRAWDSQWRNSTGIAASALRTLRSIR